MVSIRDLGQGMDLAERFAMDIDAGPAPHYQTMASAAGLRSAAGPGPETSLPQPIEMSFATLVDGLNPLHHLPGVGMIYRAITGATVPEPLRILGAGLFGGPIGMMGAAMAGLALELLSMPPDTSRPALPAGMSQSAEAGVQPGMATGTDYTTLATVAPDWLGGTDPARAAAAYRVADRVADRASDGFGTA